MALVRIGNYPLKVNPQDISWTYSFTTQKIDTIGGTVIQFLSCKVDSLSVSGQFSSLGEMEKFEQFVMSVMGRGNLMDFSFPSRGWSAKVRIRQFPSLKYSLDNFAPMYTLTMVVEEGLAQLAKTSKDAEFASIMDGIRWERNKYNAYDAQSEDEKSATQAYLTGEFSDTSLWKTAKRAGGSGSQVMVTTPSVPTNTRRNAVMIGGGASFDSKDGFVISSTDAAADVTADSEQMF